MTRPPAPLTALPSFKRVVELLARQAAADWVNAGAAWATSTATAVSALLPAPKIATCGTDGRGFS
jgi:hypothetical protein